MNPNIYNPNPKDNFAPIDIDAVRSHPAIKAIERGESLRGAAAYSTEQGVKIWPEQVRKLVEQRRKIDGDDWLPPKYVLRSEALLRKPPLHSYPIYAKVPAGAFGSADQTLPEPIGQYLTDLYVKKGEHSPAPFAMEVRGHSMTNAVEEVHFPEGARVLCDPARVPALGDFVVVLDQTDGSLTLKRLANHARLPHMDLWLDALNADYQAIKYNEDLHQLVGVVVDAVLPLYRKEAAVPSKKIRR